MNKLRQKELRASALALGALWLAAATLSWTGCKAKPTPVEDEKLAATVQSQINSDSALAGQSVLANSQQGVVTLSGTVQNDAQRTIAARDAAGVQGVARVIDALTIGSSSATVTSAPPAPVPAQPAQTAGTLPPEHTLTARERREQEAAAAQAQQQQAQQQQAREQARQAAPIERQLPPPQQQAAAIAPPAAPPAPPKPVFRTVSLAAGTTIPVRMTQTLDSGSAQAGTTFSGVVASDILADEMVAIPAGSAVTGLVDTVQDAAHFKGSASLSVTLSTISRRGEHLAVTTDPYTVQGKGRGANTAEKVGGGAAVGAILGGILGHGAGAAIGAAAGAGTGAGVNAVTRGQQVQIASETVVRFHLANPITVRVRADGADAHADPRDPRDNGDPALVHHNQ